MQHTTKNGINGWKYAFIILLVLVLVGSGTFWYKVTRPIPEVSDKIATVSANNSDRPIFKVTLTKKQAERISNTYINKILNSKDIHYKIRINSNNISLLGKVKFLGSNINFKLLTKPYRTNNDGIQLKAQKLEVGKIGVPISFVMDYIQHNYHFPKWVKLDSNKKLINVNLEKYKSPTGYHFKVKDFNLKKDRIAIDVYSTKIR